MAPDTNKAEGNGQYDACCTPVVFAMGQKQDDEVQESDLWSLAGAAAPFGS